MTFIFNYATWKNKKKSFVEMKRFPNKFLTL